MKPSTILLIAALSLATGSAAIATPASNEITPLTYDSSVSDIAPVKLTGTCMINIVRISDERFNKESIGAEFPIVSSPSEPWIESGFDRLKEYGFPVQRSAVPVANAINLNVRLIRAYTWFGNMRINGMVAIDIDMASSAQHSEKFRATGSKTNMWNAKSEHVTALNYALNHTMHKMAQALQSQCTQAKLVN
jgi:hypothetical protein